MQYKFVVIELLKNTITLQNSNTEFGYREVVRALNIVKISTGYVPDFLLCFERWFVSETECTINSSAVLMHSTFIVKSLTALSMVLLSPYGLQFYTASNIASSNFVFVWVVHTSVVGYL
jgi:hypothetical protein